MKQQITVKFLEAAIERVNAQHGKDFYIVAESGAYRICAPSGSGRWTAFIGTKRDCYNFISGMQVV